jgi:transcription antitermination factor NusG
MLTRKNWYVVYTKAKCERKVAASIELNKIEAFCPLIKVQKQWSDRKKAVEAPLFSSYVFVHVTPKEHGLIKQMTGVVNFVHWLNKPAIVKEEEILSIKSFIQNYKRISLEKATVSMNEVVKIIEGPFMNKEGNVVEIKHKTVKVYLPSLGYNLVAEFEKSNIQLVEENEIRHSRRLVS